MDNLSNKIVRKFFLYSIIFVRGKWRKEARLKINKDEISKWRTEVKKFSRGGFRAYTIWIVVIFIQTKVISLT